MLRRALLINFRSVYRLDRWLRRRFTPTGYLVLYSMGVALVIGMNTYLNLASQIFTFLSVVLLLSIFSSLFFRPTLRVQRILPPCATAMEPLRYTLQVTNTSGKTQRGLALIEELEEPWPSHEEFLRYQDPLDRYRNPFDRFVGFPKWVTLVQHKRGADVNPAEIAALGPQQSVDIQVELLPKRRGYLHFQGYRIARPDLFGLFNGIKRFQASDALLVLPKRYPVAKLQLAGAQIYQPGGVPFAGASAESEECVALRDYRQGDSLRAIHWKSWAKAGKPIVKDYRPEYFTRHALILDTFMTSDDDTRFEAAVSAAASLVASLDLNESLLDLLFIGPKVYRFTAGRGLHSATHLLNILACVEAVQQQPFSRLHKAVMEHAGQFSSVIALLLDWDSPRQQLVRRLRSRNIPTLALVVCQEPINDTGSEAIALPTDRLGETLQQL